MKYYAVISGREGPSIYTTWEECNKNISGYSGAIFKSFRTKKEANHYFKNNGVNVENTALSKQSNIHQTKIQHTQPQNSKKRVIIFKKENPLFLLEKNSLDSVFLFSKKEKEKDHKIIVFTDGSCSHQGTNSAKAGAGVYFPQMKVEHSSKVIGKQTNNRGELYAVILALRFITEVYQKYYSDNGSNNLQKLKVEIHIDSTYVIKGIKDHKNSANLDLWKILNTLINASKGYLEIKCIKELAHSGVQGNEIADRLAKINAFS